MSKDYTVAKELASLKEIKQSAEQRISELSLNALNYVNDHRLHKTGGGSDLIDWDFLVEIPASSDGARKVDFGDPVLLKGDYESIRSLLVAEELPVVGCVLRVLNPYGTAKPVITTCSISTGELRDVELWFYVKSPDGSTKTLVLDENDYLHWTDMQK